MRRTRGIVYSCEFLRTFDRKAYIFTYTLHEGIQWERRGVCHDKDNIEYDLGTIFIILLGRYPHMAQAEEVIGFLLLVFRTEHADGTGSGVEIWKNFKSNQEHLVR